MITLGATGDGPAMFPFSPGDEFVCVGTHRRFFILSASEIKDEDCLEPTQIITAMMNNNGPYSGDISGIFEAQVNQASFRGWSRL